MLKILYISNIVMDPCLGSLHEYDHGAMQFFLNTYLIKED